MDETWIGGRFELAVDDTWEDEDDEPAPDVIIWVEEQSGAVVALVAVPADEPIDATAVVLEAAMREPDQGEPRRPRRVRVEHEGLAAFLRTRFDDIVFESGDVQVAYDALERVYADMVTDGGD